MNYISAKAADSLEKKVVVLRLLRLGCKHRPICRTFIKVTLVVVQKSSEVKWSDYKISDNTLYNVRVRYGGNQPNLEERSFEADDDDDKPQPATAR